MAWLYLLVASVLEVAWTYSLKFMNMQQLRSLRWGELFTRRENWLVLAPFAGYLVFGIGNVLFFSLAMKQIPAATALAVWMGATLVGVKLVDILILKEPFDPLHLLYIGLILVGIVGLKRAG